MLEKNIFRSEIREILLDYMVRGSIRPGQRLSIPEMAAELDVSATPIREALTQLTESGLVTYKANRGFFVTELSKREATELYEAIALLESEALQMAPPTKQQIELLKTINQGFSKAGKASEKLEMDRMFHQTLISGYSNQFIRKLIADIRVRIVIYESEFMESAPAKISSEQHGAIIEALENENLELAISLLKTNWHLSISHIMKTFQAEV